MTPPHQPVPGDEAPPRPGTPDQESAQFDQDVFDLQRAAVRAQMTPEEQDRRLDELAARLGIERDDGDDLVSD